MARFHLESVIIDTKNATATYEESTVHDGRNFISCATGSEWEHQTLYRSAKGRYYVVNSSAWQHKRDYAEWYSPENAVRWLLMNKREIPEELQKHVAAVTE